MKVIRRTKNWELNKGNLQAEGLFNMSSNNGQSVSLWFDKDTIKELNLRKCKVKDFEAFGRKMSSTVVDIS